MAVTYVKVYTEYETEPRHVVPFTDASLATTFAREIAEDDGLAGISAVTVVNEPTDQDAIDEFWREVNAQM